MTLHLVSNRPEDYLVEIEDVIDFSSEIVREKIEKIKKEVQIQDERAHLAFNFVRDEDWSCF